MAAAFGWLGLRQLGAVLNTLQQQGAVQALVQCQHLACSSTHMSALAVSELPQQPYAAWTTSMCSISRPFCSSSSSSSSSTQSSSSSNSQYSRTTAKESLQEIRARIFEQHIGDGRRSGRKAILRPLKGRHIASWYFTLTNPKMPMIDDEIENERMMKVQLAHATGGGPPKKGQGKRAGKKK